MKRINVHTNPIGGFSHIQGDIKGGASYATE